jgi:hypothetical protein
MTFAIYRLAEGELSLIAEGTREYTPSDIEVAPWGKEIDGYQERRKALELADGFGIGIVTMRHHENDGFGLWLYKDHHPAGFSWEWFSRGEGGVFTKLQGKGYVRVTYTQVPKGVEIPLGRVHDGHHDAVQGRPQPPDRSQDSRDRDFQRKCLQSRSLTVPRAS